MGRYAAMPPKRKQKRPGSELKKPARPRVTKAEKTKRIMEVLRLRIGGAECPDLVQFSSAPEQNWQVGERQLRKYIAAADALMKKYFDAKADYLLNRHLLQRRQLYAHALGAGDWGTALRVLQDEAKLEHLYPELIRREVDELRQQV